jgi:hypothetical protein
MAHVRTLYMRKVSRSTGTRVHIHCASEATFGNPYSRHPFESNPELRVLNFHIEIVCNFVEL